MKITLPGIIHSRPHLSMAIALGALAAPSAIAMLR